MSKNKNGISLYLTSSAVGEYRRDGIAYLGLNPANQLIDELSSEWRAESRCLFLPADPLAFEQNEETAQFMTNRFNESHLSVGCFDVCDAKNNQLPIRELDRYDFLLLGGGHVPTQNAFFREIGLFERIQTFNGIVMGISAGSMNCATFVYAQPELPGESIAPNYERFIEGLDLTSVQVLPHYQTVKNDILDGKRLFEDITYPDSIGHRFYAIPDGSYILQRNGIAVIHGEARLIENGECRKICDHGKLCAIEQDRFF